MRPLVRFVAFGAATGVMACGGGDATAAPVIKGIRFVSGVNLSDTASATLAQALVIEVHDANGALVPAGTAVRFTGVSNAQSTATEALVSVSSSLGFGSPTTVSTDETGRASVLVRLGTVAGPARVAVSVPAHGFSDTARYTVQPGAAAKVAILPADTMIIVGTTFSFRGGPIDQFGNTRSDPVTWAVSNPAATVSSTGAFGSSAIGRFSITATAGSGKATVAVSVAPGGRLAVWQAEPSNLLLLNFDGTHAKQLTLGTDGGIGLHPAWMPNGSGIVFTSLIGGIQTIQIADTSGGAHPFFQSPIPNVSHAADPTPTADGKWLYFSAYDTRCNSGLYCLYRSRIDGSAPELIGTSATANSSLHPSPSPDGSRVAFQGGGVFTSDGVTPPEIKVFDVASKIVSSWSTPGLLPSWSPDGTQIAFAAIADGAVWLIKPDGSGLRKISGTQRNFSGPAQINWSADGKYLVAGIVPASLGVIDIQTGAVLPLGFKQTLVSAAFR